MSTGGENQGFVQLFYPQCSDIRTVIYLSTQVFHSSWNSEMRVCRTPYTPELSATVTLHVNGLRPFPQRPVLMQQNEQKVSVHLLQKSVFCCNECICHMCVCVWQMGEKPSFDITDVQNLGQFHILPQTFIYLSTNFQAVFEITSWPYYLCIFSSLLCTQHKTLV